MEPSRRTPSVVVKLKSSSGEYTAVRVNCSTCAFASSVARRRPLPSELHSSTWRGFVVLSAILAVATLVGMALFTWLALLGFDRIRIKNFERYEAGLLGGLFALLGVIVIALEQ